jgi:hypothetical protein
MNDIYSIQIQRLLEQYLHTYTNAQKYQLIEKLQSFLPEGVKPLHILTPEELIDCQQSVPATCDIFTEKELSDINDGVELEDVGSTVAWSIILYDLYLDAILNISSMPPDRRLTS